MRVRFPSLAPNYLYVVELETKTVTFKTDKEKLASKAIKAIEKAGYEVK